MSISGKTFKKPAHDEILWIVVEPAGVAELNEMRAILEEDLGEMEGSLLVSNFEPDNLKVLSREEALRVHSTLGELLGL